MENDFWFKPKTYGYGASPSNWKGWAAIVAFVVVVLAFTYPMMVLPALSQSEPTVVQCLLWVGAVFVLTLAFIRVCKERTDGEWRWRWGERMMERDWRDNA